MSGKKQTKKYLFSLYVNLEKIDSKYGLVSNINYEEPQNSLPSQAVTLLSIDKPNNDVISFLDEGKRPRKCTISSINHENKHLYRCFWDKHELMPKTVPVGCPIKYKGCKLIKSYFSEISRDKYSITENITEKRLTEIKNRCDNKIETEKQDCYITDGIFCSFNCLFAFIKDNKTNPLYKDSEVLMYSLYEDITGCEAEEIMPAPHWRNLICFGGHMTIEEFRKTFNKINIVSHGIRFSSIGRLYEERLKF